MTAEAQNQDDPLVDQISRARADECLGWWFRAVLDSFSYLESAPRYELHVTYDPEDTGRVGAYFWIREDKREEGERPEAFTANDLLRSRGVVGPLPDLDRLDCSETEALDAIEIWSRDLRVHASDVLRGA